MLHRIAVATLAWIVLTSCTITHVSIGSPIDEGLMKQIEIGRSNEADVLSVFGAPDRIVRHEQGDTFVYEFVKRVTRTFSIEEPVITNLEIFTYSSSNEREDRLIVLFDKGDLVESFGYMDGIRDRADEDEPEAP